MSENSKELILYWAPEAFATELATEIKNAGLPVILNEGPFFLAEGAFLPMAWSESTWRNCRRVSYESISKAAKFLEGLAPFWTERSFSHHRRASLVLEQLRELRNNEIDFPAPLPEKKFGAFSLLSEKELLYSVDIWPQIPPMGLKFREDQTLPSRAYMKLWEALTVHAPNFPRGAKCLEIGASPGGWTAVLRKLDCEVWAFDRSELAPELMKDPKVHFARKDAFSLKASDFPQVEWVFSDVICYPEKLYAWVTDWIKARPELKFICTIKFQGPTDFEAVRKFKEISGSTTLHLHANKHELTWIRV